VSSGTLNLAQPVSQLEIMFVIYATLNPSMTTMTMMMIIMW